ncbi:hypothetical protein OQA88_5082 [Cercophora sp. LCS_1]
MFRQPVDFWGAGAAKGRRTSRAYPALPAAAVARRRLRPFTLQNVTITWGEVEEAMSVVGDAISEVPFTSDGNLNLTFFTSGSVGAYSIVYGTMKNDDVEFPTKGYLAWPCFSGDQAGLLAIMESLSTALDLAEVKPFSNNKIRVFSDSQAALKMVKATMTKEFGGVGFCFSPVLARLNVIIGLLDNAGVQVELAWVPSFHWRSTYLQSVSDDVRAKKRKSSAKSPATRDIEERVQKRASLSLATSDTFSFGGKGAFAKGNVKGHKATATPQLVNVEKYYPHLRLPNMKVAIGVNQENDTKIFELVAALAEAEGPWDLLNDRPNYVFFSDGSRFCPAEVRQSSERSQSGKGRFRIGASGLEYGGGGKLSGIGSYAIVFKVRGANNVEQVERHFPMERCFMPEHAELTGITECLGTALHLLLHDSQTRPVSGAIVRIFCDSTSAMSCIAKYKEANFTMSENSEGVLRPTPTIPGNAIVDWLLQPVLVQITETVAQLAELGVNVDLRWVKRNVVYSHARCDELSKC